MRKILFRGKRKDTKKWISGHLMQGADITLIFPRGEDFFYDACEQRASDMIAYEVIPETVGQYTGLTDKNGTEIYERDIVKGKDNAEKSIEIFGYVDFTNGSFVVVGDLITHYRWIDYEVVVIGNIHDTPELLEGSR